MGMRPTLGGGAWVPDPHLAGTTGTGSVVPSGVDAEGRSSVNSDIPPISMLKNADAPRDEVKADSSLE